MKRNQIPLILVEFNQKQIKNWSKSNLTIWIQLQNLNRHLNSLEFYYDLLTIQFCIPKCLSLVFIAKYCWVGFVLLSCVTSFHYLHTTLLGFPVPLGTASLSVTSLIPLTSRHLRVDDVTSWPYFDLIEAWRPRSVQ